MDKRIHHSAESGTLAPMIHLTYPDRPRLRPGLAVLRRRPDEIQIGLDPRQAMIVGDLPAAIADVAGALTGARTTAELLDRVGPRHREQLRELITGLADRGLVEDAAGPSVPLPRRLAGDLTAATVHRAVSHPKARATATVSVHGDGRLAVATACLLAAAGVGGVRVEAGGQVQPEDVGAGFRPEDVGRPRAAAARDAVTRVDPGVRDSRGPVDLALLTDALVPDPAIVARLVEQGVPHLPIRIRDGVGIVGPLVIPAATACLTCADLHRTDRDRCWPTVAAQLAGRPQLADLAAVHATAGLAAAQVLAALRWLAAPGPHPPAVWTRSLELDPVDATIVHRPWPPHPRCACGTATG